MRSRVCLLPILVLACAWSPPRNAIESSQPGELAIPGAAAGGVGAGRAGPRRGDPDEAGIVPVGAGEDAGPGGAADGEGAVVASGASDGGPPTPPSVGAGPASRPAPPAGAPVRPEILGFAAAAVEVPVRGSTSLEIKVGVPPGERVDVRWSATCGVAVRRPREPTRAVFLAPATPGFCEITARVENGRRTAVSEARIRVQVLGRDGQLEVGP